MTYAKNFDLQWNIFRKTQLDSYTGESKNSDNFFRSTKWSSADLRGKYILVAGCGPGKYTEILLKTGAIVTVFDLTTAVFVNQNQNSLKGKLSCFQGDIYNLPNNIGQFDFVFCYGVLQHCPDPNLAYQKLYEKLKPGGRLSIDFYTNPAIPSPWTTPKYLWRRWSKNLCPHTLLWIIRIYIPFWLPIDLLIRVIPLFGPILLGVLRVPCWNYLDVLWSGLKTKSFHEAIYEWYAWAVMDTFDALGAKYDFPKTENEVRSMVDLAGAEDIDVFPGSNGIVANVRKAV